MKSTERRLVELLTSSSYGVIFSCNAVESVREELFRAVDLQTLLGHLLSWFKSEPTRFPTAEHLVNALQRIAAGLSSYTDAHK